MTLGYAAAVKDRRRHADNGELRRPSALFFSAALTASALMIAACGGTGSNDRATQDARAACQALVRSQAQLSPLSLSVAIASQGPLTLPWRQPDRTLADSETCLGG